MKLFGAVLCAFASAAVTDRQEEDISGTVKNEYLKISSLISTFLSINYLRIFSLSQKDTSKLSKSSKCA